MSSQEYEVDLSERMISEPLNAYRVNENRFAVARGTPEWRHAITYGLLYCKAITIHHPAKQKGLVGHLATCRNLEGSLDNLVTAYQEDLTETDIHLVEATRANAEGWPTLEELCDYFFGHNPRSLRIDRNRLGTCDRGVALDLVDGRVSEIDGSNGWTWSDRQDTSLNQYLCVGARDYL